ncbi:MAG TPA: hypothetical protein VMU06_22535 [Stellaceae bacterium]|nr:hypothetical protein [Stellaceae bacterium]
MKRLKLARALIAAALVGCVPIKGKVSLQSGSEISGGGERLREGEGIAILGASRAGDDEIAKCVREALAAASPATRIAPAEKLRSSAGGALASANAAQSEQEIGRALQEAIASHAISDLALRYVYTVEGATGEDGYTQTMGNTFATAGVGVFGSTKFTHIEATVWDAATGHRLGLLKSWASGRVSTVIILPIGFYTYAPTESTACKEMAGQILRHLDGEVGPNR